MQFEVHFSGLAVLTEKKEDNSPAVARISRRWTPEIGKEKWEEEKELRLGRNCVGSCDQLSWLWKNFWKTDLRTFQDICVNAKYKCDFSV